MSHPLLLPLGSHPARGRLHRLAALSGAGLLAIGGSAWAQTTAPTTAAPAHVHAPAMPASGPSAAPATVRPAAMANANPAEARASTPPMRYQSALAAYRPWSEQAVGDWRALNDQVGRIGGWRTYLQQAHAPDPEPPAAGSPEDTATHDPAAPATRGHGHGDQPDSPSAAPQGSQHRGGHHGQGRAGAHGGHGAHSPQQPAPAAPRQP